jgi:hypothetical protein
MMDWIVSVGSTVFFNLVQLIAGSFLAVSVSLFIKRPGKSSRVDRPDSGFARYIGMVIAFSAAGALLPLGAFGLLPVVVILVKAGYDHRIILPALVSNCVFNMLVPFCDSGFIWRTGFRQVILAVVRGVSVGVVMRLLKSWATDLFRDQNSNVESGRENFLLNAYHAVIGSISFAGIYLIVGVFADVTFNKYLLPGGMNLVFTDSRTSFIPLFLSRHDISSPSFLLVLTLVTMLMDLARWSACLAMLKFRGIVLYAGCFIVWLFSLALPAFIK